MTMSAHKLSTGVALAAVLALACTGCATGTNDGQGSQDGSEVGSGAGEPTAVTLVVHNSFANEEFEVAASEATGYDVRVVSAGDGGELSAQLVLTKGAPIADAFFGIDDTFASRIIDEAVSEPFTPATPLSGRAQQLAGDLLPGGAESGAASTAAYPMVPITQGATCINIDPAWFAEHEIAEPTSYDDLAHETYRGLSVLLDPTSSSTGASFLVGTIAKFGEGGFEAYWEQLAENEPRIAQGWDEAYYTHFTQSGGTYPIVLSYSSSPAYTVNDEGTATATAALLETCSSQIEYAGVLAGAANPEGAKAVVDYMLSREFQDTIAESMYMNPVDEGAYLPAEWAEFAPFPSAPNDLPAAQIGAGRDGWLKSWSAAVS